MSFARNVRFTVKNGKVDELNRLMHTEVLPHGTPRVETFDSVLSTIPDVVHA